jgi:hypothetical protein
MTQNETTTAGVLTYDWTLTSKQAIQANYQGGNVYAGFNGIGYPHAMTGDTWSVTSTSGGITSTLSGNF